jgi:hypothetical protein
MGQRRPTSLPSPGGTFAVDRDRNALPLHRCGSVAVRRSRPSPYLKRYLLNAWMIIHSYNDHVRLLLPNLRSSMQQSLIAPRQSRHCYEINWAGGTSPKPLPTMQYRSARSEAHTASFSTCSCGNPPAAVERGRVQCIVRFRCYIPKLLLLFLERVLLPDTGWPQGPHSRGNAYR